MRRSLRGARQLPSDESRTPAGRHAPREGVSVQRSPNPRDARTGRLGDNPSSRCEKVTCPYRDRHLFSFSGESPPFHSPAGHRRRRSGDERLTMPPDHSTTPLAASHLAASHLAASHLAASHLAASHLAASHLAANHLAAIHPEGSAAHSRPGGDRRLTHNPRAPAVTSHATSRHMPRHVTCHVTSLPPSRHFPRVAGMEQGFEIARTLFLN